MTQQHTDRSEQAQRVLSFNTKTVQTDSAAYRLALAESKAEGKHFRR